MKVSDIATRKARSCDTGTNLAAAAWIMWENDCGIVPIADRANKVVGLLTDRDICMAVATRRALASDITAGDVMSGKVYSCRLGDDVRVALRTMAEHAVRRLPVVNEAAELQGVLSLSDVVLAARDPRQAREGDPTWAEVMQTLASVSRPRQPAKEDRPKLVIATGR